HTHPPPSSPPTLSPPAPSPTHLPSVCLFFSMIRRPPRSPLFPYTTALPISTAPRSGQGPAARRRTTPRWRGPGRAPRGRTAARRSEEHTSELQSLTNLVCRLLLEKKK